jgi:hypothetical protein
VIETDLRTRHRPTDRSTLAREVQRLAAGGLTIRDISQHLALGERAVAELLRPTMAAPTRHGSL